MKTHLIKSIKNRKLIVLLTSLFLIAFFSSSVEASSPNSIKLNLDDCSTYPKALEELLPSYPIDHSHDKNAYYIVDNGGVAEAFHVQAIGALQSGLARYWYPQYLATVVIAVDKDQTNREIRGWKDLLTGEEEVAFLQEKDSLQMEVAAIAYGLEGEDYSLDRAISLLTSLHKKGQLAMNSSKAPILICYDYQAAALKKQGRNLSIIIPSEGTFTYEKGLLSNKELVFEGNLNKVLAENSLPLLDGQRDSFFYPDDQAYTKAKPVTDLDHFSRRAEKTSRLIERKALGKKRFMSIDYQEHLVFALLYLIIVTIWTISLNQRSTQKSIGYAALLAGFILIGWTLVRLVRYQIIDKPLLSRYLWYSYYIFQLSLPLVIVWMAWAIDKSEKEIFPPKWWRVIAAIVSFLIFFVFTNDLHGHVLKLDMSRWDWGIHYTYGFGYYMILTVCMGNLLLAFFLMGFKSMKSPRRKGFIGPLVLFVIFAIYNYKYIMRDPLVYETDLTIVTGIFAILMFESCVFFGLIPINSKYIELFKQSPLKLQVFNKNKERLLRSASADLLEEGILDQILLPSAPPITYEDSLVFANPIPGGYAVWHEDLTKINHLYREIQDSTDKLREANLLLTKELEVKKALNEQVARKRLIEELEGEISQRMDELLQMVEKIDRASDYSQESIKFALLLTYIKRRSNFFFIEKEEKTIHINLLILYIEELSKVAKDANFQVAIINEIESPLASRYATLFYDFFYEVVNKAVKRACPYIINNLEDEGDFFTMHLLPSEDIGIINLHPKLEQAIIDAKGFILSKYVEDSIGISISFPKGGPIDD